MEKFPRTEFFRYNPEVKAIRHAMGCEKFDAMYRSLYRFLSELHIGQYFTVANLCKKDPDNHRFVLLMCTIYNSMDFFVHLQYDAKQDRITVMPTFYYNQTEGRYCPPDVYSKIIKDPKAWGIDPNDI